MTEKDAFDVPDQSEPLLIVISGHSAAGKDTVKVLMQVKSGEQTRFVALTLKKA